MATNIVNCSECGIGFYSDSFWIDKSKDHLCGKCTIKQLTRRNCVLKRALELVWDNPDGVPSCDGYECYIQQAESEVQECEKQ